MKHAILILVHNNFSVVRTLLEQLDSSEFDIYIHVDGKVKDFPRQEWIDTLHFAEIHFVQRVKIVYCEYSMVEGVKNLFLCASQRYHDYYHMISGADIMIKSKEEFLDFFKLNKGKEFVGFWENYTEDHVRYRNYFIALMRQKSHYKSVFFIRLRKLLIALQKCMKLQNWPDFDEVKKGPDWYSISHEAVMYMLRMEPKFKKYFRYAFCPTEYFAQTLLWNSDFRHALYLYDIKDENLQSLREIDWNRGTPYVYHKEDFALLKNSKAMFARKFDENVDMEIVKLLHSVTRNKKGEN